MPDLEQIPFSDVEFADNPEPRCPCVLLLDTSYSMSGEKIAELNRNLGAFAEALRLDTMAAKRVEVAICDCSCEGIVPYQGRPPLPGST